LHLALEPLLHGNTSNNGGVRVEQGACRALREQRRVSDERILAIDIGAGTMDVLVHDAAQPTENAVQLVLPSATSLAARKIAAIRDQRRPVFLHGNLMGGYHTTNAVWAHLQAGLAVYATETAARTVHDDLDLLRSRGIVITDEPPQGA